MSRIGTKWSCKDLSLTYDWILPPGFFLLLSSSSWFRAHLKPGIFWPLYGKTLIYFSRNFFMAIIINQVWAIIILGRKFMPNSDKEITPDFWKWPPETASTIKSLNMFLIMVNNYKDEWIWKFSFVIFICLCSKWSHL